MKKVLLIGAILFCAQWMNAQTPCENMFSKAKNYYESKDYANAKTQFQKVVNNCDSNKETAQEYIKLCEGYSKLAEQQKEYKIEKTAIEDCVSEKNKLNARIKQLEKDNDKNQAAVGTAAEKMKVRDSIIAAKSDSIQYWKARYESMTDTLRDVGDKLNACLKSYKENKKVTFEGYDKINDAAGIIEVMSKNLDRASKKSKK